MTEELKQAFDEGWRMAAEWANRDDLIPDMDSPHYANERSDRLASLPTQPAAQATPDVPETDFGKMATPEPVGEPYGYLYDIHFEDEDGDPAGAKMDNFTRTHSYATNNGSNVRPLYTRPAPGVPEGLPAVLTDWGFDVHDDEEGRTWLTIRNPDDDVARMSVPTVWPLNGNQTIGAVVLHQFRAALTSALAAAEAKGVDHD